MRVIRSLTATIFLCALSSSIWAETPASASTQGLRRKAAAQFSASSLLFEENRGQAPKQIDFVSNAPSYRLYLQPAQIDLYVATGKTRVPQKMTMAFESGNRSARGTLSNPTTARSGYLIGGRSNWIENLVNYEKVHYDNVWPGIGVTYYGTGHSLEYDIELQAGADPDKVQLVFPGTDGLRLDSEGNLLLKTASLEMTQHKPHIYQRVNGETVSVAGQYRILPMGRVGFEIADYDHTEPLVIDPVILFNNSSLDPFIETANGVADDINANIYITGETFQIGQQSQFNGYFLRLDPTGKRISLLEFGGTDGPSIGRGITVDNNLNAYIVGQTAASNFIVNCLCGFQSTLANAPGTLYDGFLVVFSPTNQATYVTYMGGSNNDAAFAVAADGTGAAYVAGTTFSSNFPTTEGVSYLAAGGTAFVVKVDTTVLTGPGSKVWARFIGGTGADTGNGIAFDSNGNVYVGGSTTSIAATFNPVSVNGYNLLKTTTTADGYVVKLNSSGSAATWFTFFPSGPISGLAQFNSRFAYVTGQTNGNINTTPSTYQPAGGANHAFFADFDTTTSGSGALAYSTYLGGAGQDAGVGIAAAPNGYAMIAGWTSSSNFPLVGSPLVQSTYVGGSINKDGFLSFINPGVPGVPGLIYSTYVGQGNVIATGVATNRYNEAVVVADTFDSSGVSNAGMALKIGSQIFDTSFFVSQLYIDLLDRTADAQGLAFWVNLINTGQETRSQVASSFFNSQEFSQAGLSIIKYYIAVLRRDPDFGGWKFWFDQYNIQHTSLLSILTSFLNMPEFQSVYGNLSNSDFVNLVYQNVLGRAPDSSGFNFWLGQLNSGQSTRADMMYSFINGAEFSNKVRPRAFANLLYMGFLRRTAEPGGLAFWTGILADPNQLPSSINTFITGGEYVSRFQ